MSTKKIYESIIRVIKHQYPVEENLTHLDIGAGEGVLIEEMGKSLHLQSEACDFHIERFKPAAQVKITKTDLNADPLPYPDSSFELVTSTEVIEHLENPRRFFREIARILKPGGTAIISTPNVLNVKSRIKYLGTGFFNLFEPLPLFSSEKYSANSHISPVSYFYMAHGLDAAGFEITEVAIDKNQRTSRLWLLLFWPIIIVYWLFFYNKAKVKNYISNEKVKSFVKENFSIKLMLGRTVIVAGRKIKKS
jgi:2-polyprenyl-3-methyl-5-hydroxy-6-metoxy-1,4-benzoquinol methylase